MAAAPPGVRIVAPSHNDLDLAAEPLDVRPLLAAEGITAIISSGAFTKVDDAEDETELTMRVNGMAPGALARAAAEAGIPIVQISTDYVFAGDKPEPYLETDPVGPRSAYGRAKLLGEREIMASGARHAILRTAWIFSPSGHNFLRTMLRLGRERDEVGVVADQFGCPTHAGDFADVVVAVAQALEDGRSDSGIWHVANAGETSWHGFALRVFERAAVHGRTPPHVKALTAPEFPTKAERPANSRLATNKLLRDFGIALRAWETAVDETVDAIIAQEEAAES